MKRYLLIISTLLLCTLAHASLKQWQTHFAYNSVELIAMDAQQVYAVANGKLFSVNQLSEQITLYTNASGLHGNEIAQIAYDTTREQLLLVYADGKIDIKTQQGKIKYIPDLYNKQLTSSKRCNNITIHGNIAYLAMDFGILTLDLDLYELVDTYYIGNNATEVKVADILLQADSIYAQDQTGAVYAANINDNIVDFRYWSKLAQSTITFDTKKGKECISPSGDIWKVAGDKGVERLFATSEKAYYLPDGPLVNTPYYMTASNGKVYVVPGGRWVNQNRAPGYVMIYDIQNEKWTNITDKAINAATGKTALDLTAIAVDPNDPERYFVSSYGTGLYEFRGTELLTHYLPHNSILCSAAPSNPDRYTRVEAPTFDAEGNLWVTVAGGIDTTLVAFLPDGRQRGVNIQLDANTRFTPNTPGPMIIDAHNNQVKWMISCRSEAAVVVMNDAGTHFDASDDKCARYTDFRDQDGKAIIPEYFFAITQAENGDVWIGSSEGPIIIPKDANILESNLCQRLRIKMPDDSYLLETERINTFAWDKQGYLWIGTQTAGVYVLDTEKNEIIACYTSDNSAMPSNTVISLTYDSKYDKMFIGTAAGLVSYSQKDEVSSSLKDNDYTDYEYRDGSMYQWRAHSAFTYVEHIEVLPSKAYGLSANSLFVIDKPTSQVTAYSQLDGLSSSGISCMAYNHTLKNLILTYQNGHIDILDQDDNVRNIADLYLKMMTADKTVHDICVYDKKAFLAMSFGVLVVNMQKAEIEDTYYIGHEGSEVDVKYICTVSNQIYAMTNDSLYCATIGDNLADFANWHTIDMPAHKQVSGLRQYKTNLYTILDNKLFVRKNDQWRQLGSKLLSRLCYTGGELYLIPYYTGGFAQVIHSEKVEWIFPEIACTAVAKYGNYYWIGTEEDGIILHNIDTEMQSTYYIDGPASNFAYKLRFYGDKLYMVPGGRWANGEERKGDIMIYENDTWRNIKNRRLQQMVDGHKVLDLMNVAQDPNDEQHYFVSSYGTGLYELYNDSIIQLFLPDNSPLMSAAPSAPATYTRTDGLTYDQDGNLWVINAGGGDTKNIHIITPQGQWYSYNVKSGSKTIEMHTPGDIIIDAQNSNWKWIPLLRYNTGLILLDDNGTPTRANDDKVVYRSEWIDQNNNLIMPNTIHSIAQDHNMTLWIGTDDGILAIPRSYDFRETNRCIRVVIPRNDGTNLGDYLLDNEQINDIKIDGANRLWVATANSGVYLLEPTEDYVESPSYYVETVAHFTTDNSILPSNNVVSLAIQASNGEVFMGTGGGLVSYMSDATPGEEDYNSIYAYPNPVRPGYQGYITIRGLAKDSEVRIVDASGALIATITGNGGTATWNGKNASGGRISSGVYTAICNTKDGKQHGTTKILIIN